MSPTIFNVFIDDLIKDVSQADCGVKIGTFRGSSFAFADDITLYSATVTGLQLLINKCASYALKWRFNFNISKSKCIIMGKNVFVTEPVWFLNNNPMEIVHTVDILGCRFNNNGTASSHVDKRLQSCRQSYYKLSSIGMSYPGLESMTKAHLWKSICCSTLTYGCDSMCLKDVDIVRLEKCQGNLIKQCVGLGKRSHHSNLLKTL